jgi:membrane-associated phospholipid phosphatase
MSPQSTSADSELLRLGSRLVWAFIAAMALAVAVGYRALGLSIDYSAVPITALLIPIGLAASLVSRWLRLNLRFVYGAEAAAQLVLISLLGGLLSYSAAAVALPYRDAELLAVDRWLGFDIHAYVDYVDTRPWLVVPYSSAYLSILHQPAIVVAVLAVTGHSERLHDFAVEVAIALTITVMIFIFVPARCWAAFLHIDVTALSNLVIFTDFAAHLDGLRSGTLRVVPLAEIRGMIAFPSFHAAAAALAAWAFWPIRYLRWPMLTVNVLMVMATPVVGMHYLVDVFAGLAVGFAALAVARGTKRMLHGAEAARRVMPHAGGPTQPALPGIARKAARLPRCHNLSNWRPGRRMVRLPREG